MKGLLVLVHLLLAVAAEAPAPYPPSGYRPNGPAFELPQKNEQPSVQSQYLPPLDPRIPASPPNTYGAPEEDDVSVQGLPTPEQLPIFQPSPINGQQYVGPALQRDLKSLDDSYRQQQYQLQQQQYREYERQRELEAQAIDNRRYPASPRQFGRTTPKPEPSTTQADEATTTESGLNEGETLDNTKRSKVTVEVTKAKLQEYPGEFYLNSLAQLQLQSQPRFVPFQLSQLRAPLIVQGSQKQVAGYDAQSHFAALPSVLAQRHLFEQNQAVYPDPALARNQQFAPQQFNQQFVAPVNQYQPSIQPQGQLQPFPQIQAQPVVLQPQSIPQYPQANPDTEDVEEKDVKDQPQPQLVYQPQVPQVYQPQPAYQPQYQPQEYQPQLPQEQIYQGQLVNYQDQNQYQNYQPQFLASQPQLLQQSQFEQGSQGQDALQSGLNVNQGNGVEEKDDGEDTTATAVATAFGTRTQPRVQYGVPLPRTRANPGYQTTTQATDEATTVDSPVVAEATAVASPGGRRKSAKLRSRRIRPVFTVDNSGHLVLAEQN